MDERDFIIRNLKTQLIWMRARAYTILGDMAGKDVMAQFAIAKEGLETLTEKFDPEPTPEQRKSVGLDPRPVLKVIERVKE